MQRIDKKVFFVLGIALVCFWVFWTWFFGFGGYTKTVDWTKAHSRFNRIKLLLDYPSYERFFKTMKIYDPLFWDFWRSSITIPVYRLQLDPVDLDFLNNNLPAPYSARGLAEQYTVSVGAKLMAGGGVSEVEVRYRGDLYDHWSEAKKSWRIEKGDGQVINLIIPATRGYLAENLANHRAEKLGLMHQEDGFVWLKVNGRDLGVYYRTGHWNEEWLTSQGKPVSQLVGEFDYQTGRPDFPDVWEGISNWKYYAWRPDRVFPNSLYLQRLIDVVTGSSEEDFVRELSTVVDLDSLARWYAHAAIMNSVHTDDRHNWRLWLDPEKKIFHFIPTDSGIDNDQNYQAESGIINLGRANNRLLSRVDQSPSLRLLRDRLVWEYVKDDRQLEDDLAYWDELNSRVLPMLYRDRTKHRGNIDLRRIGQSRQMIVERIASLRQYFVYQDLQAQVVDQNGKKILLVTSFQPTSVMIDRVMVDGVELQKADLFLHSGQTVEIPVDCRTDCAVAVVAVNLVTDRRQEVSAEN